MADISNPRVSEKRFYAIPTQILTADGTADGTLTISSTYCWKVGQVVTITSSTSSPRRLKIKAILSENILKVGPIDKPIYKFSDVSDLLVADTATVELVDEAAFNGHGAGNRRPTIDLNEIYRQVYEEEPTVAYRNHLVDWLGRSYNEKNPMPISTGIDGTEKIKKALMEASDLIKVFTWVKILGTDVISTIVFTSSKITTPKLLIILLEQYFSLIVL